MNANLLPAHLEPERFERPQVAVISLLTTPENELSWLMERRILSVPALVRTIVALKQNGIARVLILHRSSQVRAKDFLASHRLLQEGLEFISVEEGTESPQTIVSKVFGEGGGYWVSPDFLINGIFLRNFREALSGQPANEILQTSIAGAHVKWISPEAARLIAKRNGMPFTDAIAKEVGRNVSIADPEVTGTSLRDRPGLRRAEKILSDDVVRKKGGYLAKKLNEPVSLWIARLCSHTPISPNTITWLNTVLGLLSAWMLVHGAHASGMAAYAWVVSGGVLFYLVDIFDGIDGELARFTFRFSAKGAIYDTISDNVTLLSFLGALTYLGYVRVGHWYAIALGASTIVLGLVAIFYLFWFTTHYYGNGSLRLYESRFLPLVNQTDPMVRLIQFLKHFYTKDIICALIVIPLFFNRPMVVVWGAPLFVGLFLFGFLYLGLRYSDRIKAHTATE